MNFELRPPRDSEWRICRMLLPETFADGATDSHLICLRKESPRVIGAVAFVKNANAITRLHLHVVPTFRRQGFGSRILASLAELGVASMEGTADIVADPAAAAFCEKNQFEPAGTLTTVEAEIDSFRDHMRALCDRISVASSLQIVPLSDAPAAEVARLHAEEVAQEGDRNAWRSRISQQPAFQHSPVLMVDGRVAGFLLWNIEGTTAVVRSHVIAADYRRTSLNALLLAESLDQGWARGARRVRFSFSDANRETKKLAIRMQACVTGVLVRYVKTVRSLQ
jgi:GNAT superfamily N-acetyltransferase